MKKFILQNLWWVTFLLAITLLGMHSFKFTAISVDSTSILLLIIILISPFIASIRKIKYGDFEAEIDPKEVQKIKSDIEKISESKDDEEESRPEIYAATDSIRELAESDPVIALAKIRIELEKVLKKLVRVSGIEIKRPTIGMLVRSLSSHEIVSPNMGKSLSEVISICNRAIHGEAISEDSANTIVSLGIDLLEDIYWSVQEQITSGTIVSEEVISNAESDSYYDNKHYRLITVIPLVENPKKIIRELTQEQLDELLEGYHEYAEFIVELVEIPKNG
ncbi:hypothetical protein QUF61_09980 [Candidatus Venteria ishoeyi]|uniref:hypothetical protein n=1 Tax=Candidatus Venteria ishoeyi TaxID=1899563 RepID=UPI0025A544E9|nr:hypothetical protein [Candidatus Venteria ishoeyi]MDM8546809.1 hypothetical protein [Candidatus Venteria ishoeyi]